jgi:hypothetical protein
MLLPARRVLPDHGTHVSAREFSEKPPHDLGLLDSGYNDPLGCPRSTIRRPTVHLRPMARRPRVFIL